MLRHTPQHAVVLLTPHPLLPHPLLLLQPFHHLLLPLLLLLLLLPLLPLLLVVVVLLPPLQPLCSGWVQRMPARTQGAAHTVHTLLAALAALAAHNMRPKLASYALQCHRRPLLRHHIPSPLPSQAPQVPQAPAQAQGVVLRPPT
jgi:hypothetical protein